MRAGDESFEQLRAALDELAIDDARELLAEARVEARARVRSMLSEALAHSMLERATEQLTASSPEPAAVERQPSSSGQELAWYVYGIVAAGYAAAVGEPAGIDARHPVATVTEGALAAVTSRVAADEFAEAPLRERLTDMEWVEGIARGHERVLDALCRETSVIPMRMCTVYRTEGGIREMLSREARSLEQALAELAGKAEWGVKVFADPATAIAGKDASPPSGTGAEYMEQRREERDRTERLDNLLGEASAAIHRCLETVSAAALVNPPQRPEASGHAGEMILNGVYLVADDALDSFQQAVATLQDQFGDLGLELIQTGPWPPYNFVPGTVGAAW
jgi:hypothetical protein